jgi:hypothetical protein
VPSAAGVTPVRTCGRPVFGKLEVNSRVRLADVVLDRGRTRETDPSGSGGQTDPETVLYIRKRGRGAGS